MSSKEMFHLGVQHEKQYNINFSKGKFTLNKCPLLLATFAMMRKIFINGEKNYVGGE